MPDRITCDACDFWDHPPWRIDDRPDFVANCKRHAPQMLVYAEDSGASENALWPRTGQKDWCGDAVLETEDHVRDRLARAAELAANPLYAPALHPNRGSDAEGWPHHRADGQQEDTNKDK